MRKSLLLATVATVALTHPLLAADDTKVFSLGEVTALAPAEGPTDIGGSVITQQDIRDFNRDTLDKAFDLTPGASVSTVGARNETNIWIRGFDRWRVPLYQDGIPVYLPVDNRIDFTQFNTATLSEIQVTKGYTSVIDGPGAIGGSVNLVSRQVSKPFEADARAGLTFDNGGYSGVISDAFVGTRQDKWFLQFDATQRDVSHWALSNSFNPSNLQPSGDRTNSASDSYSFNLKAGYAPNATDEYDINILSGNASKDSPPPDTNIPNNKLGSVKYWDWPSWDKQSIYWLSKTAIDDQGSYVKTKLYYDRFFNAISMYDNIGYTAQNTSSAEFSQYDDRAAGASVEVSKVLLDGRDTIRFASIFRYDQHNEKNNQFSASGLHWYETPWETGEENTYSQALENTFHPLANWDWKAGISYDYRQMLGDTQWVSKGAAAPYGYSYQYPVAGKEAFNYQTAVLYHYNGTGTLHASFSDRSRFPTMFEMYSTRFSTYIQNPFLRPEEAFTTEAGWNDTFFGRTHLGANVYFARMLNAIATVPVTASVNQSQNVGTEYHEGFETEFSQIVTDQLRFGGHYAYLMRSIVDHIAMPTDSPRHKGFAFAEWSPIDGLRIIPSADISGKRWVASYLNGNIYYREGDNALINIKAAYQLKDGVEIEAGVKNLTDENYVIEDGYNGQGRNFFTNVRVKF